MNKITNLFSNVYFLITIYFTRLLVVLYVWIIARTSYVPTIYSFELPFPFFIALGGVFAKFLITFVLEISSIYDLTNDDIISNEKVRIHLSIFGILMLMSEFMFLITVLKELNDPTHLSLILAVITSGSLLSILLQPSFYPVFWGSIFLYILAMIIAIVPKSGYRRPSERTSLILFLRSLFLPL